VRASRKFILSTARTEKVALTVGLSAFNVINHRNDECWDRHTSDAQ